MQPDPGLNRGPSAYRANTLPTELPDCLHIIHPVPVLTQVTPPTLLPPFLLRFDVEGVESDSFQRRTCSVTGGHGTKTVTGLMKICTQTRAQTGDPPLTGRTLSRLSYPGLPTHNSPRPCTYPSHSRYTTSPFFVKIQR